MSKIRVGDQVTCKSSEEVYYSGYAGNPVTLFEPGMVGTVASIAPKVVIKSGPNRDAKTTFCVVDFQHPDNNKTYRVGLNHCNAVLVKSAKNGEDGENNITGSDQSTRRRKRKTRA